MYAFEPKMELKNFHGDSFSKLINCVVPLIMEHPDANDGFDELLAQWMSDKIKQSYSNWKINQGRNKTLEQQITMLMKYWRADSGSNANVYTLLNLLEKRTNTTYIREQIRAEFELNSNQIDTSYCTSNDHRNNKISAAKIPKPYVNISNRNMSAVKRKSRKDNQSSGPTIKCSFPCNNLDFDFKKDNQIEAKKLNISLQSIEERQTVTSLTQSVINNSNISMLIRILFVGEDSVDKDRVLEKLDAKLSHELSGGYYKQYISHITTREETIDVNYLVYKTDKEEPWYESIRRGIKRTISYGEVDGVILLYDIKNRRSFSMTKKLIKEIQKKKYGSRGPPSLCILGDELDVIDQHPEKRKVGTEELRELAKSNSASNPVIIVSEISSSTGHNLQRIVSAFGTLVINNKTLLKYEASQHNTKRYIRRRPHFMPFECFHKM